VYEIALSVLSCLRAGTAVHVAWAVSPTPNDPAEAVAITPGGGKIGDLMGGALDHLITEALRGSADGGQLVEVTLGPVEALITERAEGTTVTLAVIPGRLLPVDIWEDLAARKPTRFALSVAGAVLDQPVRLEPDQPGVELSADRLVTSLVPVTRVVISGGGPLAAALAEAFHFIGWQPATFSDVSSATGLMATLSSIDAVVVMGHDVETAGRALQAAIESGAGYIGSIGSPHMQELRRQWLAYRGVAWDDRVRGPAGLSIGASSPPEIAVSIVAEAISVQDSHHR
jgi:xanthine dehydrogenase accessory factor